MFERFTEQAKRVVARSQREAMGLGHDHIGTEHLLLGMLNTEDGLGGTACDVLTSFGVTLARARPEVVRRLAESGRAGTGGIAETDALAAIGIDVAEIKRRADETFGPGRFQFPRPPFTVRAKKVLELALRESVSMGNKYIGTEHLLLGLVRDGGGVAVDVLTALGVPVADLRPAVLARTTEGPGPTVDWDDVAGEIVRLRIEKEQGRNAG